LSRGLPWLGAQQLSEVGLDRFRQRLQVVAALQAAQQPALAVCVGNFQHLLRQRTEIFRVQTEGADRILGVGVEAGAEQYELGFDLIGSFLKGTAEKVVVILPRRAEADRLIEREAEALALAGFAGRARAGVKTVAVA